MKWATIVVIFFVNNATGSELFDEDFHQKTECCRPRNASHEANCDFTDQQCVPPSWELLNTTNGRFKMSFDFPRGCNIGEYTAELGIHDRINSDLACTSKVTSSRSKHTIEKLLTVVDWEEGCTECDKKAEFFFQFIFTGCYWLIIKTPGNSIEFCYKFLDSNYQKRLLNGSTEITPKSTKKYPAKLQIDTYEYPWKEMFLVKSTLDFTLRNATNQNEIFSTWTLLLWPDRRVKCTSLDRKLPPECDVSPDGILELRLAGVEPGDYEYEIYLDGDKDNRCYGATLWNMSSCRWTYHQTVPRIRETDDDKKSEDFAVYIPILVSVILVSIFLLIATNYAMKRTPLAVPVKEPIVVSIVGERPAILLLYSRDCEEFMKLMQSFRGLLEKATQFQVYDCHDPRRWSELSRDGSSWIQRLTLMRDMRVIAVATRCARLRQRAQLDGRALNFADPRDTDKLFTYGLRLLSDRLTSSETYKRVFVVRFDGFSDDDDLFLAINSFTRYVIPSHIDKLIGNLKQGTIEDSDETWMQTEEVKILRNDLENLVRSKQLNTNYLQNLLVIQETNYEPEIIFAGHENS